MTDLINLLPLERVSGVRRHYFFRLTALAAYMLVFLVGIHAVLLIPSYVYVHQDINGKTARVAALSASGAGGSDAASVHLATLSENAAYLARLSTIPSMSGAVALVLSVPHGGVSLNSFGLGANADGTASQMTIAGIADTRQALSEYVASLQAKPWVKTADLPISAYAAATNLPFTITLTGSFIAP